MHSQKEIKADHEPECLVLGAFRQSLQTRWAVYTLHLCGNDPDLNEKIQTKQELRTAESKVKGTENRTLLFTLYLCGDGPQLKEINHRKQAQWIRSLLPQKAEHCPLYTDLGVSWTYINTSADQSKHKTPSPRPHAGGIEAKSGAWWYTDQSPHHAVCSPGCSICHKMFPYV